MKDQMAFFRRQAQLRLGDYLSPEWEARLKQLKDSGAGISILSALGAMAAVRGVQLAWGMSEHDTPNSGEAVVPDAPEVVVAELPPVTGGSLYEAGADIPPAGLVEAEPITATIYAEAPVALTPDDSMSFGEAFAAARAEVGQGGVFMWQDQLYSTYYEAEWASMDPQARAQYWDSIDQTAFAAQEDLAELPEIGGELDALDGVALDMNGNGVIDAVAIDADADGIVEAVPFDQDEDGAIDAIFEDSDLNGQLDRVRTDQDGDGQEEVSILPEDMPQTEEWLPSEEPDPVFSDLDEDPDFDDDADMSDWT